MFISKCVHHRSFFFLSLSCFLSHDGKWYVLTQKRKPLPSLECHCLFELLCNVLFLMLFLISPLKRPQSASLSLCRKVCVHICECVCARVPTSAFKNLTCALWAECLCTVKCKFSYYTFKCATISMQWIKLNTNGTWWERFQCFCIRSQNFCTSLINVCIHLQNFCYGNYLRWEGKLFQCFCERKNAKRLIGT